MAHQIRIRNSISIKTKKQELVWATKTLYSHSNNSSNQPASKLLLLSQIQAQLSLVSKTIVNSSNHHNFSLEIRPKIINLAFKMEYQISKFRILLQIFNLIQMPIKIIRRNKIKIILNRNRISPLNLNNLLDKISKRHNSKLLISEASNSLKRITKLTFSQE